MDGWEAILEIATEIVLVQPRKKPVLKDATTDKWSPLAELGPTISAFSTISPEHAEKVVKLRMDCFRRIQKYQELYGV